MKYFGISFHRTATRSLNEALNSAGINSLHYPRTVGGIDHQRMAASIWSNPDLLVDQLMPVIQAYDGHTDVPWPGLWQQVLDRFPNSKFIAVTRDEEAWWKSLSVHWRLNFVRRRLSTYERIQYARYIPDCALRTFGSEDRDVFIEAYRRHLSEIRKGIPADRLLVLDLLDPQKEDQLAAFLQTPSRPVFPHLNNSRNTNPVKRVYRKFVERVQNEFLPL